MLGFTI